MTDSHEAQDRITDETVRSVLPDAMNREPIFRLWYRAGFVFFFRAQLTGVVTLRRRDDQLRVLDLGCGTGGMTRLLGELLPQAEVMFFERSELQAARRIASKAIQVLPWHRA